MADAGIGQQLPRKLLARVLLAGRRDVGMRQHPLGQDFRVTAEDRLRQRDHGRDLLQRELVVAEFMTGVHDFDADGSRVDVRLARPGRHAGVPGALVLRHALHDAAVLEHDVVRRDLALGRGQALERGVAGLHARIMKKKNIRRTALAGVEVR